MSESCAALLVEALGIYGALGASFAAPFLIWGAARIDPAARGSSLGFRFALIPGVALLWPWLAWRWWSGRHEPPEPRDSHRRAARGRP